MPVDLQSLQADPDFQRLSPAEQRALLQHAQAGSRAGAPPDPAPPAPGATTATARVQVDTLTADPDFQALSPQEQQALLARATAPPAPATGPPGVLPRPPADPPLEETLTKPTTLIPLLMGGAGLKATQRVLGEAAPYVGRLVRPVVEGLSQTLGFGAGRTIETGKLPTPGELGTEFVVTAGTGRILEDIGAIGMDVLRRSKGGQAILTADAATNTAYAKWQADTQAAEQAAATQQKDLYDTAVIRAKASQREYAMATRQRQQTITAHQQDYDTAVRSERESRYDLRQREIAEQQADYQAKERARTQGMAERQQAYEGAITQQGEALTQARAIPGRYTPETPSWVQYEKYGDAAQDAVVDLVPAKTGLADMRAQRGLLPDGTLRPFPSQVESIAATLEKAADTANFQTIREELRRLGPLTRHGDSTIRGPAKQLFGLYADVLEASPAANDLLRQANATFRKEMAVQDITDWLKPGHGVVSKDRFNREKINVAALFTKMDKTIADDALFRGSFTPQELASLQADVGRLAGTPTMPTRTPTVPPPVPVPQPEYLPGSAPNVPQRLMQPPREPGAIPLPGDIRVQQVPQPPPAPAPAPTTPRQVLGERPGVSNEATALGQMIIVADALAIPRSVTSSILAAPRAVQLGAQQSRWLLANAMLDPGRRKMMQAAIDGTGTLHPRVYGLLLASLSSAEKQAYARETRETEAEGRVSIQAPGGPARMTD
jgi:hypothetical protein